MYHFSENLSIDDFNSLPKIATVIGKNNPGAVSILRSLYPIERVGYIYSGKDMIEAFDHLKIYGANIWAFFQRVCGQSLTGMEHILLAVAWEFLDEDTLHAHINQGVGFIDLPSIAHMIEMCEQNEDGRVGP